MYLGPAHIWNNPFPNQTYSTIKTNTFTVSVFPPLNYTSQSIATHSCMFTSHLWSCFGYGSHEETLSDNIPNAWITFSHCCDQISNKDSLRQQGLIWLSWGCSPQLQGSHGSRHMWQLVTLCLGSGGREVNAGTRLSSCFHSALRIMSPHWSRSPLCSPGIWCLFPGRG